MPTFYYNARQIQDGSETKGYLEASSPSDAIGELRSQGLLVLNINTQEPLAKGENKKSLKEKFFSHLPVFKNDKILLFRQLALMMRSGLNLTSSLSILIDEAQKKQMQDALKKMLEDVRGGVNLSESMKSFPRIFAPLDINLIASAELSGEMHQCLDRSADHHNYWGTVRAKMIQALIYPCIVLLFVFGVGFVIVFKIIPTSSNVSRNVLVPICLLGHLELSDVRPG